MPGDKGQSMQGNDPNLLLIAKGLIGPCISAGFGLVLRWTDDVRKGKRLTLRRMLIEAPSAIGFGIIGGGTAAWLDAPPEAGWALAALLGHLGTMGVLSVISNWRGQKRE